MSDSQRDLAQAFEHMVNDQMSFLGDLGFLHIYGQSRFNQKFFDLAPVNYDKLPGILALCHRYYKNDLGIEITYGDRKSYLESQLWLIDDNDRYGLGELCLAAERPTKGILGSAWVLTLELMAQRIAMMAESIQANLDIICHPIPELLDRARALRGRRLKYDQEKQRKRHMEMAINLASAAFRARDYKSVIENLAPFRDILPKSQLKKLSIAKRRTSI